MQPTMPILTTSLDAAIAAAEHEHSVLEAATPAPLRQTRRGQEPDGAAWKLQELELLIVRLQQIKDILNTDPRLMPLIDDHIGAHVQAQTQHLRAEHAASEQHQWRANLWLSVATTLVGALIGWFFSALSSPNALFMHFTH